MKRSILALAGAAALVVSAAPAASAADDGSAAQACKAQRQQMGTEAFRLLHGTNHNKANAFGKCVSKQSHQQDAAQDAAAAACLTEQQANPVAFDQKYATNKKKSNAFGKCVSAQAATFTAAAQDATVEAAKACRAEQQADPAAFAQKHGTNANKRNAFGKCVSSKTQATASVPAA